MIGFEAGSRPAAVKWSRAAAGQLIIVSKRDTHTSTAPSKHDGCTLKRPSSQSLFSRVGAQQLAQPGGRRHVVADLQDGPQVAVAPGRLLGVAGALPGAGGVGGRRGAAGRGAGSGLAVREAAAGGGADQLAVAVGAEHERHRALAGQRVDTKGGADIDAVSEERGETIAEQLAVVA